MNEPRGGMRVHPSKMGHTFLEHAGGEFFFSRTFARGASCLKTAF